MKPFDSKELMNLMERLVREE